MRARERNQRTMTGLGIEYLNWLGNRGHKAEWLVRLKTGRAFTVWVHTFSTETGVLREAAKVLANEPVRY